MLLEGWEGTLVNPWATGYRLDDGQGWGGLEVECRLEWCLQ